MTETTATLEEMEKKIKTMETKLADMKKAYKNRKLEGLRIAMEARKTAEDAVIDGEMRIGAVDADPFVTRIRGGTSAEGESLEDRHATLNVDADIDRRRVDDGPLGAFHALDDQQTTDRHLKGFNKTVDAR